MHIFWDTKNTVLPWTYTDATLGRSSSSPNSAIPISGFGTRSVGSINRSLSFSCILAPQESSGCSRSSTSAFFQISSIASRSALSNALNSCCSASPSARCAFENCSRCGSSFLASPVWWRSRFTSNHRHSWGDVPWVTVHLATSFETDRRRYSSSSTVPLRPDPTLRSIFRLVLELRLRVREPRECGCIHIRRVLAHLDALDVTDGAAVYLVNAVGAIDTSVITSTLRSVVSSVP